MIPQPKTLTYNNELAINLGKEAALVMAYLSHAKSIVGNGQIMISVRESARHINMTAATMTKALRKLQSAERITFTVEDSNKYPTKITITE